MRYFWNLRLLHIDFWKVFIFCRQTGTVYFKGLIFNTKTTLHSQRHQRLHLWEMMHLFLSIYLVYLSAVLCGLTNLLLCHLQYHQNSLKPVEALHVNSQLCVNSCLIYKISIYGSVFKVPTLQFWYRVALLFGVGGGGTKTTLNSISVERKPSAVSRMSEVEFTRQRRWEHCRQAAALSWQMGDK